MKDKSIIIRKVTIIGLIANLFLATIKFIAGYYGNSKAVIADAIHSTTDLATDFAVIIGSYFWTKPPDETHHHGHGRVETIVTLFIGVILFLAGIDIFINSFFTMKEKCSIGPSNIAAIAAFLSILVKEILYRWTIKKGNTIKSSALTANAWHHRLDAFSSIPVLIVVIIAMFFPRLNFIDKIGAIIVSFFIIQAAIKIIIPGINEFLDGSTPKEICDEISLICMSDSRVKNVHKIRTRYIGGKIHIDLHIEVDGSLSIVEGHSISGAVKQLLFQNFTDISDVLIHIEPFSSSNICES